MPPAARALGAEHPVAMRSTQKGARNDSERTGDIVEFDPGPDGVPSAEPAAKIRAFVERKLPRARPASEPQRLFFEVPESGNRGSESAAQEPAQLKARRLVLCDAPS